MSHNEEIFEKENIPMGPLFMVLGVTAFFTAAIVFALTGFYQAELHHHEANWAGMTMPDSDANIAMQNERLSTYAKLEDGKVQIPIERAMELVISESK